MGEKTNRASIIFGAILVLLGIFFLFSQFMDMAFNTRIGQYTWPFLILVPGALVFILAFISDEKTGSVLIIPGSIVSAIGLLLFFQNVTGLWASWAYAWAFVFPISVGLGQVLFGMLREQDDLVRTGWNLVKVGGIILLAGFTFFELLIGVSGFGFFGLRGFCFPALLILGGLLFILFSARRTRQVEPPAADKPAADKPAPSSLDSPG